MKKISAINVKINFDKKEKKNKTTTLNASPTISLQLICHVFIHYIGQ